MRERLTFAFVGMAIVLLAVVGVVRSTAMADLARTSAEDMLVAQTGQVADALEQRYVAGEEVTTEHLEVLVGDDTRMAVTHRGAPTLAVAGSGFDEATLGDALEASATVGTTTVTAVQSDERVRQLTSDSVGSLLALMLALVVLSGAVGFVLANRMAKPITALARGAAALGRGRFDLDLPESSVPEIAAVSSALEASANQLRASIHRDREYVQHTSHVLRTPLTGLRLELEEALILADLEPDVRRTITRCLQDVTRLQDTVTELVEFQRARALVSGAEVTMLDLGLQVANRWRSQLPMERDLRTFVDSGEDLSVTPGPIEQLLDNVLRDVADHGSGSVAVHFDAASSHLRVKVTSAPGRRPVNAADRVSALSAQTMTELLGGRWTGDAFDGGLEILLPRR